MRPLTPKFPKLLHGGDYNPEQWLRYPEILKQDVELMKKADINCVSVGIFSWAHLEPNEGEYDFDWLEKIIDNLYKNGIYTVLATPSGAKPLWMSEKYEEIRRVQNLREDELFETAKQLQVPVELLRSVHENGRLPVVNFAAGGVATPADAALMMQLGAEGVFVGSGIFKSGDPAKRAAAIVKAVTNYTDAKLIAELSTDLGEAMVGINENEIALLMAERGK